MQRERAIRQSEFSARPDGPAKSYERGSEYDDGLLDDPSKTPRWIPRRECCTSNCLMDLADRRAPPRGRWREMRQAARR